MSGTIENDELGVGLPAPTPSPDPALSRNGLPDTVKFSLPCIKCWYDVRAMRRSDRCPECGTPVSRTLRSLHAADHRHLRRLRTGLALSTWGIFIGMLLFWLLPIVAFYVAIGADAPGIVWAVLPLCLIGPALTAVGLPIAFAPEGRLRPALEKPASGWLQAACWLFVLAAAAAFVLWASTFTADFRDESREAWLMLGAFVTMYLGWLTRNAVLFPHLRRTARRLSMQRGVGYAALISLVPAALWAFVLLMTLDRSASRGFFGSILGTVVALAAAATSLWAIVRHGNDLAFISRRLKAVLRFRASNGKSGKPRF